MPPIGRVAVDGGAVERHIAIVDVDPPTLTVAAIGSRKARGAVAAASPPLEPLPPGLPLSPLPPTALFALMVVVVISTVPLAT